MRTPIKQRSSVCGHIYSRHTYSSTLPSNRKRTRGTVHEHDGRWPGGCSSAQHNCSIRQHASAYVSIRQHTGRQGAPVLNTTAAYVSIRQHTSAYFSIRQHTLAYVSIRQHTSAYVSIRQHTSAYGITEAIGVCGAETEAVYSSMRTHSSTQTFFF
jgi:hypothetical protein